MAPRSMEMVCRVAFMAALVYSLGLPLAAAQGLKIDSHSNIAQSAHLLADDLMTYYHGNEPGQIPGLLDEHEYPFWESGIFLGSLIDYWHLTGNSTYNDVVTKGLLHQTGPHNDFRPANQTSSEGNDDQCFWGLNAMMALENQFPDPLKDKPQWLTLAETVFNEMAQRVDQTCDGGLRWQVYRFSNGYSYKNTISSACFFDLAARLARYTGNQTYSKTAEKTWNWLLDTGLIDGDSGTTYDGAQVESNCSDINRLQWSYTPAILAHGASSMFSQTSDSVWRTRVETFTKGVLERFFPRGVAVEVACESEKTCTTDMMAYKGLAHQWLAEVTQLAPFTADSIRPVLLKSATAAVHQCTGGSSGRACGFYWSSGKYVKPQHTSGAGEQMSVLAAVSNLLITNAKFPATKSTKKEQNGATSTESKTSSTSASPSTSSSSSAMPLVMAPEFLLVSMLVWCGFAWL